MSDWDRHSWVWKSRKGGSAKIEGAECEGNFVCFEGLWKGREEEAEYEVISAFFPKTFLGSPPYYLPPPSDCDGHLFSLVNWARIQ